MNQELDRTTAVPPLVEGDHDFASISDLICGLVERPAPRWWWLAFLFCGSFGLLGLYASIYVFATGLGIWGMNQTVGWGLPIGTFVFWVGIGHAGTLISAILFLFRQKWRSSLNRAAEAMTLFAVCCAGLYVIIHIGRFWIAWYLVPLTNSNALVPNFRSALSWDFAAISVYGLVSLMFWYVGLIPDMATLRDRATTPFRRWIYGLFALGWRGSGRHWHNYEMAYLMLAGLATPLVVSVHTVVSFDFAISILPGWHSTIFPPYFVTGAIFSGLAMVITLLVPLRRLCKLEDVITITHLQNMCKLILTTSLIIGYAYATELFMAWYAGNEFEMYAFKNRIVGPYGWCFAIDGPVQRDDSPAPLVPLVPDDSVGDVPALALRQHRHVVRAVRDRDNHAAPRLPAVELDDVLSHLVGLPSAPGRVRPVHDALPDLHTVLADGRDQRGQGLLAGGRPAPSSEPPPGEARSRCLAGGAGGPADCWSGLRTSGSIRRAR